MLNMKLDTQNLKGAAWASSEHGKSEKTNKIYPKPQDDKKCKKNCPIRDRVRDSKIGYAIVYLR